LSQPNGCSRKPYHLSSSSSGTRPSSGNRSCTSPNCILVGRYTSSRIAVNSPPKRYTVSPLVGLYPQLIRSRLTKLSEFVVLYSSPVHNTTSDSRTAERIK